MSKCATLILMRSRYKAGIYHMIQATLALSLMTACSKVVTPYLSVFMIVFVRSMIGCLLLSPFAFKYPHKLTGFNRNDWIVIAIRKPIWVYCTLLFFLCCWSSTTGNSRGFKLHFTHLYRFIVSDLTQRKNSFLANDPNRHIFSRRLYCNDALSSF